MRPLTCDCQAPLPPLHSILTEVGVHVNLGSCEQVGSLEAAARKEVEAALAPLRGAWPPRLPDWLAAFNGALGSTLNRIR